MKSRLMSAKKIARQNDIFDLVWPFFNFNFSKREAKTDTFLAKFLFSKKHFLFKRLLPVSKKTKTIFFISLHSNHTTMFLPQFKLNEWKLYIRE
jgi:hypothetical protein